MLYAQVHLTLPGWLHDLDLLDRKYVGDEAQVALAIELSERNVLNQSGGPFGAAMFDGEGRLLGVGVNRVVPQGTERDAAVALARKVARKSAHTIRIGKEAFYRQAEMSLADAYRFAAEVMTDNMMARDAREGICAFIEKRQPTWQDR